MQGHLVLICLEIILPQARTGKPPITLHLWKIPKLIPVWEWTTERVTRLTWTIFKATLPTLHLGFDRTFLIQLRGKPDRLPILSFPRPHWHKIIVTLQSEVLCFSFCLAAQLYPREICISLWGHEISRVQYGHVFLGSDSEESSWSEISTKRRRWAPRGQGVWSLYFFQWSIPSPCNSAGHTRATL